MRRAPLALLCSAALAAAPAASAAADTGGSASAPITVNLAAGGGIRSLAAAVAPSAAEPTIRVDVDEVARADGVHWWVTATQAGTTSTIIEGWGRSGVLSTRRFTASRPVETDSGTVVVTLLQ